MDSDPKLYEISYLAKAVDDQAALECAGFVGGAVEKEHGIIAGQNQPSRKALSYDVDGEKEGWWGWIKFMTKPETINSIEQALKANSKILRFAIFKINKSDMAERAPRKKRIIQSPPAERTDIAEIDKKLEEILGS